MSTNGNSRTNIPSKRDSQAGFRDHNNDNRTNENSEKTKKPPVNFSTPPELQQNEAAARASSRVQRVAEQSSDQPQVEEHEDEDDPCLSRKNKEPEVKSAVKKLRATPGVDPRFQQQNQTLRCFVMYTDFYRCEKILGDGHEACTWFRDVFTSICPNSWIERWDELREEGRFLWSEGKTQGTFPGDRYGV